MDLSIGIGIALGQPVHRMIIQVHSRGKTDEVRQTEQPDVQEWIP
ncbi:MAG: hypothetical protein NTY23_04485 [Chloroflexi bacterium]|nr:hypothetical protein [Chloroflexota bacterium]